MLKIVFVGAGWFANHGHGPALAHYAREHPGEVDPAAVCVRKSVDKAEAYAFDPPHLSNGVYGEASAFIAALREGRGPDCGGCSYGGEVVPA